MSNISLITLFRNFSWFALCILTASCNPKLSSGLRKNDLKKDVSLITSHGVITIRLYDATPLHRDNYLKLVKQGFYDKTLFHRVINGFMIQGGDPFSRTKETREKIGGGGPGYTLNAELNRDLFHKKGAVAAARLGDDLNPEKRSSGSQFYVVQGRSFTDEGLDSVEVFRLKGSKLPLAHREAYKTIGGAPHLDFNYTVFGEVLDGFDVIDKIAAEQTGGEAVGNRPLKDVRIIRAVLIKRKSHFN